MTMKFTRHLALSTALFGMLAGNAWAADPDPVTDELLFAAVFGLSAGAHYADYDFGDSTSSDPEIDSGTDLTLAGNGAVNIPFGVAFSAQLDVQTEFYDRGGEDDFSSDDALAASMVGGHLSLRDPGLGLIGIFAGAGGGTNDDSSSGGEGLGYLAGVEAQGYLGNFTLYGQVGWADFEADDFEGDEEEGFVDGWFAAAEARFFFHEDFMIYANAAYGEPDPFTDGENDGEVWNWGAGGKLLLSSRMPIYGTLDYRGGTYEETDGDEEEIEEHAVLAGFSFLFGAPSLMENDRRGATLSTPMLPARAEAWTEAVD